VVPRQRLIGPYPYLDSVSAHHLFIVNGSQNPTNGRDGMAAARRRCTATAIG